MTALVTGASALVGCWLTATLAADGIPVVAQMRGAPSALFRRLGLVDHPQAENIAHRLALAGIHVRQFPDQRTWLRFGIPSETMLPRLDAALAGHA